MNKKETLNQTVNKINEKQGENTVVKASEIGREIDKAPEAIKSSEDKDNNYCMSYVNSENSLPQNMEMSRGENVFKKLYKLNINEYVEKKNNLSYLSWTYAWAEAKKRFPTLTYKINLFGEKQLPYIYDENTGYMVFTEITIDGLTHSMWLPVMDASNKAMKDKPYTYDTKYKKGIVVEAATMFDINKAIMRCLVKNLAMFGLGLYIYAGEDLPEIEDPQNVIDKEVISLLDKEIDKYKDQAEKLKKGILTKYKVKSLSELSKDQAKEAINRLKNFKKKEEKNDAE